MDRVNSVPTRSFDAIYLSPHLDDVALSCGGQIYQQTSAGARILVLTVAAGWPQTDEISAFARQGHVSWGFDSDKSITTSIREVVQARRSEDATACGKLGAEYVHWTVPDCIYRRHPETGQPLYASEGGIFGVVDPVEQKLVDELATEMAGLPAANRIIAPLGLGNHVDHQIVHLAAEACFGDVLYYFEDYPYVQRHPEALPAVVGDEKIWLSEQIGLGEAAKLARLEAILAYQSQIVVLFGSASSLEDDLSAQIEATGGERLWRRRL